MSRILTISLAALLLSGCIAEWKNPNGPQRWSGTPASGPQAEAPFVNPTSHSGSSGPQP
jgi:PBP1b-binding outer membrane lipoprotein LpoB